MKSFCYAVLSFLMLAMPMAAQSGDAETDKSWYNNNKKEFAISTVGQLRGLSELVANGNNFAGKTIYLRHDIDLSNTEWAPIGNAGTTFAGTFDGNGFSVKLGKVTAGKAGGLFGEVGSGTIQNLNVTADSKLQGVETFGLIAGKAGKSSTITFCTSNGNVQTNDAKAVGGIVGTSEGKVEACVNYCAITAKSNAESTVGGIAGKASGTFAKCHNEANITSAGICGGIIGQADDASEQVNIWNCFNNAQVNAITASQIDVDAIAGGIVGKVENANMEQCYNNARVGAYCYKQGEATPRCQSYAGGLIGIGRGTIATSYNVGNVVSRAISDINDRLESLSTSYSGGLIGYLLGDKISSIAYCYNAGYIYGFGKANNRTYINYGGVLGDIASFTPNLKCCYYLDNTVKAEAPENCVRDIFVKNIGIVVNSDELASTSFLYTSKEVTGLNDQQVFAHDDNMLNEGYPVCPMVQTQCATRTEGNMAILKGSTNASGVHNGFYFWLGGLEEYAVDQPASSSFESKIEMPQKGEDCYIQAYIITTEGDIMKGNIQKIHIPEN